MTRIFTAPGKMVVAGEYAVLFGHEALSVSVDRRVRISLKPSGTFSSVSGVVECVLQELRCREISVPPFEAEIDSSQLHAVRRPSDFAPNSPFERAEKNRQFAYPLTKLGLGSSAAVAVALTRALLDFCHQDAEKTLEIAFAAHDRFTGGLGSGIDVATSYYGGAIKFRSDHRLKNHTVTPCSIAMNPTRLVAVYTNSTQSTTSFLKRVADISAHRRKDFDQAILGISQATQTIVKCMTSPDTSSNKWQDLRESVFEHNSAMQNLGRAADINIMTSAHTAIAQIARRHNGAAKPSGAGGGDLALCFIEEERRPLFIKELQANSFSILDLHFCDAGVE